MSYRDDLEAALSRIAELERQLASEEASHEQARQTIEQQRDEALEALQRLKSGDRSSPKALEAVSSARRDQRAANPKRHPVLRDLAISLLILLGAFQLPRISMLLGMFCLSPRCWLAPGALTDFTSSSRRD